MGEQVQIVICGTQEQQSARLEALLSSWAEEACVCLYMKKEGADYLSARCCADCNLLFVDSEGMFCDTVAQIQKMRENCPQMGVILLSDNPKFVIEAYQCHPDGLIRKPLTYQKLCDVMGRCFLYWQAGIRWMDLPVNHRRLRIPLCRLHYMEAALASPEGLAKLIKRNGWHSPGPQTVKDLLARDWETAESPAQILKAIRQTM